MPEFPCILFDFWQGQLSQLIEINQVLEDISIWGAKLVDIFFNGCYSDK